MWWRLHGIRLPDEHDVESVCAQWMPLVLKLSKTAFSYGSSIGDENHSDPRWTMSSEPLLYNEFVETYLGTARLVALQWVDASDLADDLVQDAFVALYELWKKSGKLPERPFAWLCRVMRNRAISERRQRLRRRAREHRIAEEHPWFTESEHDLRMSMDPSDMKTILKNLDTEQREIVILKIWGDLTWDEMSQIFGQPKSTIHRHWLETLTKLREMLE